MAFTVNMVSALQLPADAIRGAGAAWIELRNRAMIAFWLFQKKVFLIGADTMFRKTRAWLLVVAWATIFLPRFGGADDDLPPPAAPPVPQRIDPPIRHFGGIAVGGFGFGGQGTSISVMTVNGVTTIHARENGQTVRITKDPKTGLKMEVAKTYDRTNADELKESQPGVFKYLQDAPQGMGPLKINVQVEIAQVYEAKDEDELKKTHPDVYALYEKYAQGRPGVQLRIEGFPGRIGPPPGIEIPGLPPFEPPKIGGNGRALPLPPQPKKTNPAPKPMNKIDT